jgi:outer membrane receptor protein involved in Fe transport
VPADQSQSSGDIIITAQKRGEERLRDVPIPITALKSQDLLDRNLVKIRDFYTDVPGLTMVPNRSSPILAIRGIITGGQGTGGLGNPTVGVVVDDVPYGASTGIGGGTYVPDLDPGDLARIEVLRGPQGTLYGASTIGGLLRYVTVDPSTDRLTGRLQAGLSGVDNGGSVGYNVRGSINVPLSDNFAVRASGFRRFDPGYIDNVRNGSKDINSLGVYGGRLVALWRPSELTSLKISAQLQNDTLHGGSYSDLLPGLGKLEEDSLPNTGGYRRRSQVYAAILNTQLSGVHITSISSYSTSRFHARDDADGLLYLQTYSTNKFTQEVRASSTAFGIVDWQLGGFYTTEHSPSPSALLNADPTTGQAGETFIAFDQSSKFRELAGFGNLTVHFTDRFDVQLGARESHIRVSYDLLPVPFPNPFGIGSVPNKSSNANAFTYLFTPRFKLTPNAMLYARLASGYRAGGINTNYTSAGVPPAYGPDKTYSYDLGFKGTFFDNALSIDGSLYHIDWKDIQIRIYTNTLLYTANAGAAKSDGAEFSADLKPSRGLTLGGWISYNNARLSDALPSGPFYAQSGDRLPYSSKFSGRIYANQERSFSDHVTGFVGGSVNFIGKRESNFTPTAAQPRQIYPGYVRADVHGGLRYDGWTLDFFVSNLTNRRGVDSGNPAVVPSQVTYIQPRTVGMNVSFGF